MKQNWTDPNDRYSDLQQDAKAFYAMCDTQKQMPVLDVLRELDPPDPEGDADLIAKYKRETEAMVPARYGGISPIRAAAIQKHAEGRATLARWVNKAANGTPIITVKDFYRDNAVTSLFPVFMESRIQQSLLATSLVPDLIFAEEVADSTIATTLYMNDSAATRSLRKISEGSELPTTEIAKADSSIRLYKYGRMVNASYEAINSQRIDAYGNFLARIGQQIGIDETDALLDIAIAGDGTTAGAAETNTTDTDVAAAGTIAFSDLLTWYYSVPNSAYRLDKAVGGKTDLRLIADLVEFSDVEYIQGQAALRIPTPVAMTYTWWDGSVTGSAYLDRMVIGIDSRRAFMAYTYGGFVQESDRVISRQIQRATFSYYRGFRKFDSDAVQVLDVNTVL